MQRRKLVVFALGAIGLAAALTTAAVVAPERKLDAAPTYVPRDPTTVLAHVAPRDPADVRAQLELASAPDRVELAVALARSDVEHGRALEDPRYFAHAQTTLARWWELPAPPPDVRAIRADIAQLRGDAPRARADLDALIAVRPDDARAHLARAVVAAQQLDYAAARASCAEVARLAPALVAATCLAPLDGLAQPAAAATALAAALAADPHADAGLRGWATDTLAALAVQRGDDAAAITAYRAALDVDPGDRVALGELADALLHAGRADDASALLAGHEAIDSLLVRRALAEHALHGPDDAMLAQTVRERVAVTAARGDRTQLRAHARFALAVESDPATAVALAEAAWNADHQLADARVLAAAALATKDPEAAQPLLVWRAANHVSDAQLDALLGAP